MASIPSAPRGEGYGLPFGATERTDAWWFIPVLQALGLLVLIGYANYAAFLGADHYHYVEQGRGLLKHLKIDRAHVIATSQEAFGRPVVWSHPACAGRCMFIRNDKEMVCLSLAAEKP